MAAVIEKVFGAFANIRIHIDGLRCSEKVLAYAERDEKRLQASKRLDILLPRMIARSNEGKWSSRSLIKEIKSNLRQLFTFSKKEKDAFETALKSKFPNVCRCKTEADLCIGIECTANADCYVVSGDSDLLVYQNVEKVLRPIPKRHHEFALYEKDDILDALDLPSATHLLLYGIISDNDYSKNVRNLGLSRNADIVAGITEASVPNMLKEYIKNASSAANVNEAIESSRFDNSLNVFYDLQQTKAKQQIDNNDFLGYHKQMTDAMKTRSQLRNQNQSLRGQFYVPKRAKPNHYRPVFSCKEAMLPPKHYD
ncbi:hypothetical protein BGZ80_008129, partial [Entomortierella chlamydospora]